MRQQGCRQCEQLTAGDCGQHGPSILPVFNLGDEKDIEITRLRAEVQKERAGKRSFHALMQQVERERDEALAALNDAKKALKIMNQNLDDLSRAKQEALAQMAFLQQLHERAHRVLSWSDSEPSGPCLCQICIDLRGMSNLPERARALLDRLQRAESASSSLVAAARELDESVKWLHTVSGPDTLKAHERHLRAITLVCEALAAWEEGKQAS